MTVKTVRVCDNRSCGAIIGDEGCECTRLTLTMTSGKAFTAELCKTCSIEIFQNHVWTELITETIIPAEPEPASNPPSEEEPETVFTEPDDDEETTRIPEEYEFDSLDDGILGYIGEKGRATITEITDHFRIDTHRAVVILARLRDRGEVKRGKGRGVWEAMA